MGYGQNNQNQERQAFSLLELNNRVKGVILNAFPETCWVRAEMSDVRTNAASGHCYLEFIEKNAITGQLVAKARGSIWAKTFRMLKPYFEMETGQIFASGLKVLVKVSIEFHELYGYSLTVLDIDPAYTLGDMIRKRMEIIRQLKEEGVFTLNKELPLPTLPKRIASSLRQRLRIRRLPEPVGKQQGRLSFLSETVSGSYAGRTDGRVRDCGIGPGVPPCRLFRCGRDYPGRWCYFGPE